MADPTHSQSQAVVPSWGGSRQKRWPTDGKLAVVPVPAEAYEVVVSLREASRVSVKYLHPFIYLLGLEVLFRRSAEDIMTSDYTVDPPRLPSRPQTLEEFHALIDQAFQFNPGDHDGD